MNEKNLLKIMLRFAIKEGELNGSITLNNNKILKLKKQNVDYYRQIKDGDKKLKEILLDNEHEIKSLK